MKSPKFASSLIAVILIFVSQTPAYSLKCRRLCQRSKEFREIVNSIPTEIDLNINVDELEQLTK